MTILVGDVLRITAKMKLFGTDDVQNIFQYKVTGGTLTNDTAIMTAIANHMDIAYGLINARVGLALTYDSVDGINVTQDILLPDTPWPTLVGGARVGDLLPTQIAACVFWPTTTPKVRTSSFLGGFTEVDNGVSGEVGGGLITDLGTFGTFMQAIVSVEIAADKGSLNPITLVFTQAGAPKVPARWRTQRRRRVGVGS